MASHAAYFTVIANNVVRNAMVDVICQQLKSHLSKFDSIVACGNSMMGIAPIISYKLNKQLIVVRKSNDGSHSSYKCEYSDMPEKYIIIDDTIFSGNTVKYVRDIMDQTTCGELYGIYLYNQCYYAIRDALEYEHIKKDKWYNGKFVKESIDIECGESFANVKGLTKAPTKTLYNKYHSLFLRLRGY